MVITGSSITFALVYVDDKGIIEVSKNFHIFPYIAVKSQESFPEFDATFLKDLYRNTVRTWCLA